MPAEALQTNEKDWVDDKDDKYVCYVLKSLQRLFIHNFMNTIKHKIN